MNTRILIIAVAAVVADAAYMHYQVRQLEDQVSYLSSVASEAHDVATKAQEWTVQADRKAIANILLQPPEIASKHAIEREDNRFQILNLEQRQDDMERELRSMRIQNLSR